MIRISLLFVLVLTIGCDREGIFSVQNCSNETAEIIIAFEENQTEILPEVKKQMTGNQISFILKYPEKKNIIRTTLGEIEKGLPIKKIIIIRDENRKVINDGDEILRLMDTDVIGEISCCPFTICL